MSRRYRLGIAILVCVVLALGLWVLWVRLQGFEVAPHSFRALPVDRPFIDAASSSRFQVRGVITLRDPQATGRRLMTIEVVVQNRTNDPIRELVVTAKLPDDLRPYGGQQGLLFGTMDTLDLVPGQAPYGLIASRIQDLPDPQEMDSTERHRFYDALRQPIRMGLWWADGEEYLELSPDCIDYAGFPPEW
ncbi:MAG: hypothetical protein ACUVX1_16755 [Chloroflexota bacterium]